MKDNIRLAFRAIVFGHYDTEKQEEVYFTEHGVTEAADRKTAVDKIFEYYGEDLREISFHELCPGVAFTLSEEEYEHICRENQHWLSPLKELGLIKKSI